MVNLKSLFALLSVFSLLMAAVGLVRFGIDWWNYLHASAASSAQLNYRGLGGAFGGLVFFGLFVLLYRWRKH